jgi:AraC-like DNA-binding protein
MGARCGLPSVRNSKAKRFGSVPSAAGILTRLAYARAKATGIALPPLLKKARLTGRQIQDPHARLPVQSQIQFLDLTADALRDEFFGFHLAKESDLRQMGLIYYVLASSETLREALQRAERYCGIANEAISVKYSEGKDIALGLTYVGVARHSDRHQIEGWMTALTRCCRQLTGQRLSTLRVRFVHRRKGDISELQNFFGCRVVFGADRDEISFSGAAAQMPVVSADPYLNDLLSTYCEQALACRRAVRGGLRARVENEMVPLLPHGKARVEEVAAKLGMSQRTLARYLALQGLTFAGILDRLRSDLATRYLNDPDLSISQIAWLLGYRQVSAFTHACKRWTGKAPRGMRATSHT